MIKFIILKLTKKEVWGVFWGGGGGGFVWETQVTRKKSSPVVGKAHETDRVGKRTGQLSCSCTLVPYQS